MSDKQGATPTYSGVWLYMSVGLKMYKDSHCSQHQ